MIIKTKDDLKNPVIVFATMVNYVLHNESDFLENNKHIVNCSQFCSWLNEKGYITDEQLEMIKDTYSEEMLDAKMLLSLPIIFPNTQGEGDLSRIKAYTLLAEYIASQPDYRDMLYFVLDGSPSYISSLCIIDDKELEYDEEKMKKIKAGTLPITKMTLKETYEYISEMSIIDVDKKA